MNTALVICAGLAGMAFVACLVGAIANLAIRVAQLEERIDGMYHDA